MIDPKQIAQDGATDGQVLTWDNATGQWKPEDAGGGSSAFTGLTDTPSSYSGQAGKFLQVNSTPDGLEFVTLDLSSDKEVPYLPEAHIYGLRLTRHSLYQVKIGVGRCRNDDNTEDIVISSEKTVDITSSGR